MVQQRSTGCSPVPALPTTQRPQQSSRPTLAQLPFHFDHSGGRRVGAVVWVLVVFVVVVGVGLGGGGGGPTPRTSSLRLPWCWGPVRERGGGGRNGGSALRRVSLSPFACRSFGPRANFLEGPSVPNRECIHTVERRSIGHPNSFGMSRVVFLVSHRSICCQRVKRDT
jgi:hypothetical protein